MDLEQLTKHQIILLTLLVSFMTSIATGIVTVSLMDQAPPGVTRTINQIVEHTVEEVVPATATSAPVTNTVKTVVVKDDDLAAQSIASVQKGIIRIVGRGDDKLIARGVIVDTKGTAITDGAALAASGFSSFEALLASGERVPLTIQKTQSTSSSITLVSVAVGTSTGFAAVAVADPSKLQLGQSVIRIGGTGTDIVGEGIIAALPIKSSNEIEASVSSTVPGSLIMTLFGEVVGLATTDSLTDGSTFYTLASLPPMPTQTAALPDAAAASNSASGS